MMWQHLLAALISISGVYTSYKFLKPHDWSNQRISEKKVLANLVRSNNDVRKKSINKLIWEPIHQGDELCNGEMIKTAEDSSASIKFITSGATMEVEPNSLVVIEESKEDVSLGVLEGGLFVSSIEKEKGQGKLRLKSGQNAIDLSQGGEVSFSVGKSGEASVQVHSGKVEASVGNNKGVTLSSDDIGTLSNQGIKTSQQVFQEVRPNFGEVIYLSLQSGSQSRFRWKPLPPGYTIYLEMGFDRQKLNRVEDPTASAPSESGVLMAPVHTGLLYWRLVAIPKVPTGEVIYSMVNKNQFQTKSPPHLIFPENKDRIYLSKGELIDFKWTLPTAAGQLTLEIAEDAQFKKRVYQQTLPQEMAISHQTNTLTKNGVYYWRIKAILKDSMEAISSEVFAFELTFGASLRPPKLISPEDNMIKMLGGEKSADIQLVWQREGTEQQFRVLLKRLGGDALQVDKLTKDPQFLFKGLSEGVYEWTVATVGENQRNSGWSQKRSFSIQRMGTFGWIEMKAKYYYIDQYPTVLLKWERSGGWAKSWQLKISQQKDLSLAMSVEVKENEWKFIPQSEGAYFAQATALNDDKNTVGQSTIISFEIVKKPLPKAPLFGERMENPLKALAGGVLKLEFAINNKSEPDEIETYVVDVTTLKGDLVQNVRWNKPIGMIENLMPGPYWVKAKVIDKSGRESGYGESRKLVVPNTSNISAPSLEGIKIKGGKVR